MELNTTFREDLSPSFGDISGISPIDISNDQESFNLFDKFFDSEDDLNNNSIHEEPKKDEGGEAEKDEGEEGNDDNDVQVTPPPPSPASPPRRAAAPARKRARMLSTPCSNLATPAPKRARLSSTPCSVSHSVTKRQTFSLHEKKQGLVKLNENDEDFDDLPNI